MPVAQEKTHLLIAGCGYVGRRLATLCRDDPECAHLSITGTTGSTGSAEALRALGVRAIHLDLDVPASLPAFEAPWSVLYTVPPATGGSGDARLANFLAALAQPMPERIVHISTSGVYGDRQGEEVDEDSPPRPGSDRARLRLDAETRVRAWGERNHVPWVILRVPGIYGPGRLSLAGIAQGTPILRREDCGPGNRIHRDDLVRCCAAALATPHVNQVFNVCDDDHSTSCEFTLEVARQAGMAPPPQITMSEAARTFSAMRLSFLGESRRLNNRRMHELLGVRLAYPDMASGIAASLED